MGIMPPLQITFRDVPYSGALEAYVRRRAAKLETFSSRITGCHVAVEAPHRHKHTGRHFRIRVDLTVPGGEVVVSHAQGDDEANQDAYSAIDEAFDRLGRRLEDHERRRRARPSRRMMRR
jgi:ribosomal subunit interface protein